MRGAVVIESMENVVEVGGGRLVKRDIVAEFRPAHFGVYRFHLGIDAQAVLLDGICCQVKYIDVLALFEGGPCNNCANDGRSVHFRCALGRDTVT
jgi:hypothetical protein